MELCPNAQKYKTAIELTNFLQIPPKTEAAENGFIYPKLKDRIYCADGFNFSVQASEFSYSTPRANYGNYSELEVGYPSHLEVDLLPYCEDTSEPLDTVYGYVPIEIIVNIILQHGGLCPVKLTKKEHKLLTETGMELKLIPELTKKERLNRITETLRRIGHCVEDITILEELIKKVP